jgi:hypothetical protein
MSQPEPRSPFSDPSRTELELILDATNIVAKGHPLVRTPEQGIADMESRIALIMTQIQQVKEQIKLQKADEKFQTQAGAALEYLNRDLTEAQDRLHEYQTQQQDLN